MITKLIDAIGVFIGIILIVIAFDALTNGFLLN